MSNSSGGTGVTPPKVGDKVHGQTVKSVEYDEKHGIYTVTTDGPSGSGGIGSYTIPSASSGGGPSSSIANENGCNRYDGPFMHPFKIEEIEFGESKVSGISGNSFEDVAKPLIKWINDNANPHAIIVIDGSSAVLYSGEKSVLTEEFIKD